MKYKVYKVYDSKTESWGMPVFEETRRDALENWRLVANDKDEKNKVAKFPGDFCLFEFAEYDRATGILANYEVPVNLGLAIEFKKTEETITVPTEEKI